MQLLPASALGSMDRKWPWQQSHDDSVTVPVLAGLITVVVTVALLYLYRERRALQGALVRGRGSTYTLTAKGGSVRRSER